MHKRNKAGRDMILSMRVRHRTESSLPVSWCSFSLNSFIQPSYIHSTFTRLSFLLVLSSSNSNFMCVILSLRNLMNYSQHLIDKMKVHLEWIKKNMYSSYSLKYSGFLCHDLVTKLLSDDFCSKITSLLLFYHHHHHHHHHHHRWVCFT